MNKSTGKGYLLIIGLFIFLSSLISLAKEILDNHGFNRNVLQIANLILFAITFIGFLLQQLSLKSSNPQAFIRSVYGAMMLKLFICMIAVFAYAFVLKNNLNKPSLFTSMGMYILYSIVEVSVLMKSLRKNKNA